MASCYVDPHNITVLSTLQIGDLVEFPRAFYSHWGVYIGDGQIVHLTGIGNAGSQDALTSGSLFSICGVSFEKACVKIDDFLQVAQGCKARRNNDKDAICKPLNPNEIVRRAREMVGEIGYNLICNNCEHVAAYLRYDVKLSEQVVIAASAVIFVGGIAVIAGIAYKIFGGSDKKK